MVAWQGSTSGSSQMHACMGRGVDRGLAGLGFGCWRSVLSLFTRLVQDGLCCRWYWGCVVRAGVVLWCGVVWGGDHEGSEPQLLRVPCVLIADVFVWWGYLCACWFWSAWWGVGIVRRMLTLATCGGAARRVASIESHLITIAEVLHMHTHI